MTPHRGQSWPRQNMGGREFQSKGTTCAKERKARDLGCRTDLRWTAEWGWGVMRMVPGEVGEWWLGTKGATGVGQRRNMVYSTPPTPSFLQSWGGGIGCVGKGGG
jgi:hypothetical protein